MQVSSKVLLSSYLTSLLSVILALIVWYPNSDPTSTYSIFPLLGLIAFGLMWSHYISDAIRRRYTVPKKELQNFFRITSYFVLVCLLLHPALLQLQLYIDGLGPPPGSIFEIYPSILDRLAVVAGIIALICFLVYELHRKFSERSWWRFVQWANVLAMYLVLWHGFTLGGEFKSQWFVVIWIGYALTLTVSVLYSEYDKRRSFL